MIPLWYGDGFLSKDEDDNEFPNEEAIVPEVPGRDVFFQLTVID